MRYSVAAQTAQFHVNESLLRKGRVALCVPGEENSLLSPH